MTNFIFKFKGQKSDLLNFKVSGLRYYSKCRIYDNHMTVLFISETNDFNDIDDCINLNEAELWNVELLNL